MTIKVNNCGDCIFRESDFNPDSLGKDTIDSCIFLKNLHFKGNKPIKYDIAVYNSFTELGENYFPEILNKRLPNCPLDKEQIIVSL